MPPLGFLPHPLGEPLRLGDLRDNGPNRRRRQLPLRVVRGRGRRPGFPLGKHGHFHVTPAVGRVHFAGIYGNLQRPSRRSETLDVLPLAALLDRRFGRGMRQPTNCLIVQFPTAQLAQQLLCLCKRLLHPRQTRHAPRAHAQVAVDADFVVGRKATAVRIADIQPLQTDATNGRHHVPTTAPFISLAGNFFWASARACTAAPKLSRSHWLPPTHATSSQAANTVPLGAVAPTRRISATYAAACSRINRSASVSYSIVNIGIPASCWI